MGAASFLLIGFLSDVAGTVAGFGSSTIFLPFALFFFPFPEALFLVACAHLFGNVARLALFRTGIHRNLILRFGATSVAFSLLGALLVPFAPQGMLKVALAVSVLAYATIRLAGARARLRPTSDVAHAGGSVSGFFAGLIGTGGAVRGAFLSAFSLPKEDYIATAAAIAIATDLTRIPVYLAQGVDQRIFVFLPFLCVTSLTGAWVGRKIVRKIEREKFRLIVLVALSIAGLKLLFDGIIQLRSG